MLIVAAQSDRGKVRETNEDAFLYDLDLGLLALADGMGGHQAGDVASRLALQSLYQFFRKSAGRSDFTWPCPYDRSQSTNMNRLNAGLRLANSAINEEAARDPKCAGMGTTVVAAVLKGMRIAFASVGDSRLYRRRGETLQQMTEDDSWATVLSKKGGAQPEQFKDIPMGHVLTNVVGGRRDLKVTTSEVELEDQDLLLLCTDGLYRGLDDEAINAILAREPDPVNAAATLVAAAVEADGSDNVSVVVARYVATGTAVISASEVPQIPAQ